MSGTNTALLVTWNIERRNPATRQARTMMERIAALSPDVVCLTEAFEGSTETLGGYEVSVKGVLWSDEAPKERKAVLWSREPWTDVAPAQSAELQSGGLIAATTRTRMGEIRVIGVCVPYHLASPVGIVPKCPPWSQQFLYLRGLKSVVTSRRPPLPVVLLGDFNQFVPRIWGSKAAGLALTEALDDLSVCTGGPIPGVNRPAIDHVAVSSDLQACSVQGLDEHDVDGRKMSDHFGLAVRIRAGTTTAPGHRL
jgi:endonuclease/exonuclease/phosphatase family metal-dependent hydrolase